MTDDPQARVVGVSPANFSYNDPAAIAKVKAFSESLGIRMRVYRHRWINEFLPGILVWRGGLSVNPSAIKGYDDVLHELGHLAILPSVIRPYARGDVDCSIRPYVDSWFATHDPIVGDGAEEPVCLALMQAGESEAFAWQYAAQVHLDLKPNLRFQMKDGDSMEWREATDIEVDNELAALSIGAHFGVHGLQASGMTTKLMFPKMLRWVQP
jgi:hypothetical protein